ncbi:MAG TPA: Flp pilus assembly protein CpaB [Herpetosiphonaceae bacterium]
MRRGSSSLLIIVGLFLLLAAGAAGVLMFYSPSGGAFANTPAQLPPTTEPMVAVVKADIDIPEGTVITSTEGLLKMGEVPTSQFSEDMNLVSIEDARNMIATSTIKAGDVVRKDALRKAGLAQKIPAPKEGEAPVKAFPIQVNSLSGVADLVQPGDFVDVVASFNLDVITFHPGVPQKEDTGTVNTITEHTTNEGASKVLLQDVEVLDVIKPAPVVEGEEGEASPTPEATPPPAPPAEGEGTTGAGTSSQANVLNSGNWIIVIAVSNQEAEVLRFALDRGINITTMLRRAGDHTTERTVGATMRILVDNYGMPMPSFPQVVQQPGPTQLDQVPTMPRVDTESFTPKTNTNNQ